MKPKLLVIELWGLGDLVIATPFLRAASERYEVTLLAKPYAQELQTRLWPGVKVVTFVAPWTAFKKKYRVWRWPWLRMGLLWKQLRAERFAVGLSARWGDPRDHLWLSLVGARQRLGFPRLGSHRFLTHPLVRPEPTAHRPAHRTVRMPSLAHLRQERPQYSAEDVFGTDSEGRACPQHSW